MRMDPVIVLIEELRAAESSLRTATCQRRRDDVRDLLLEIRLLEGCLAETSAASAAGAAELLRLAAEYLSRSGASIAGRLLVVADRLSEGERVLKDMIWLRAAARLLARGSYGVEGIRAAELCRSAVSGATRPVLIFRSVDCLPRTPELLSDAG
jgi:hypothetical protein